VVQTLKVVMKPEQFGTEEYPLRSSKLPALSQCTLQVVQSMLGDDEGGIAADTGSAVHKAIEAFHRQGNKGVESALKAMTDGYKKGKYPKAVLADSAEHFRQYAKDPRNIKTKIFAIEEEIKIKLPPHEIDKTKKEIVILGTLDQIRQGEDEKLYLWDVKTGSRNGSEMVKSYALQAAAYCKGGTEKFGVNVYPGGIIRTATYVRKTKPPDPATCPDGIFYPFEFAFEDIDALLEIIRQKVALVRMGYYSITPGSYCGYCNIQISQCGNLLQSLGTKLLNNGKAKPISEGNHGHERNGNCFDGIISDGTELSVT
jgi:hypothetical protein